jgi:hypothetical protein
MLESLSMHSYDDRSLQILLSISQAICERKKTSSFYPKFVGSSITNVSLSVLKDKAFAAMFGTGAARPMSYTSMG